MKSTSAPGFFLVRTWNCLKHRLPNPRLKSVAIMLVFRYAVTISAPSRVMGNIFEFAFSPTVQHLNRKYGKHFPHSSLSIKGKLLYGCVSNVQPGAKMAAESC